MKHSWGKKFRKNGLKTQICKTCSCKRHKGSSGYLYSRSGNFGMNRSPDCIDMEFENSKTID